MSRLLGGLYENRATQSWVRSLDVWETDGEMVYAFDLPGLDEDRISIEVHDDTLTVSGERERVTSEQGDRFYRFERRYGSFSRAAGLPQGVAAALFHARLRPSALRFGPAGGWLAG